MNRIAMVYQSKYGSTEKYAKWIAEALSCDLFDRRTVTVDALRSYDTMSMLHKTLTKKNPDMLSDEDKEMLETYGKEVDFTDRRSIAPIISYVQTL